MTEQRELREMRVKVLIADLRDVGHDLTVRAADALSLMQAELNLAIVTNDYLRKRIDEGRANETA